MEEIKGNVDAKYTIRKYNGNKHGQEPFEVESFKDNTFLTIGIENIWKLSCGSAVTNYDNTNGNIGVGNGTVSASASQTNLQGASTAYSAMDSGYPEVNNGTATFYSTFGTAEANFDWEEFTVTNASGTAGQNINRKVSSQGTKASGSTWEIEIQLIIS